MILCYIPIGWLGALIVLVIEILAGHNAYVKFHGWQGLLFDFAFMVIVMIPCWILDAILGAIAGFGGLFTLIGFCVYVVIVLIVIVLSFQHGKTGEKKFQIPLLGQIAANLAGR